MLRLHQIVKTTINSNSLGLIVGKNYYSKTSTSYKTPEQLAKEEAKREIKKNKIRVLKKKGQLTPIIINPKELKPVEQIKEKPFKTSTETTASERLKNYLSHDDNKALVQNQDYYYSQNYLKLGLLRNLKDLPEDWTKLNPKSKSKKYLSVDQLNIPEALRIEMSNSSHSKTPFPRLGSNSPSFVAVTSFIGNAYARGMLNTREKLNVLDTSALKLIEGFIKGQIGNGEVRLVSIHTTTPGIIHCSGMDFRTLYEYREATGKVDHEYFKQLSKVFYLISSIPKPFMSLQDGLSIGAGCAFSSNSGFRVCSEKTIFSIPDCSIGFFPNAGNLRFLARVPNGVGKYLALTGRRLRGAELMQTGIANIYVNSAKIPLMDEKLSMPFNHQERLFTRLLHYTGSWKVDLDDEETHIDRYGDAIKRCFESQSTIEEVLSALESEISDFPDNRQWAQRCIDNIKKSSPISIKLTMKLFKLESALRSNEELPNYKYFERDYNISMALLNDSESDFWEGIKCSIISPAKPKWRYSELSDVTDTMIDEIINYIPPTEQSFKLRQVKTSNLYFEGLLEDYLNRNARHLTEEDTLILRNSFMAQDYRDPIPEHYHHLISIHNNKAQSSVYEKLEIEQELFTMFLREGNQI